MTLSTWYLRQINNSALVKDELQLSILQQLDVFIDNFTTSKANTVIFSRTLRRILKFLQLIKLVRSRQPYVATNNNRGFYIYGNVGSGKSMIMNQFYISWPSTKKLRTHFHQFMETIHHEIELLHQNKSTRNRQKNPLYYIASKLSQQYEIIFLDEMHINDIADAMLLKNLLISLFACNIYLVTTSNYPPRQLYPDGLLKERFLPAISLLEHNLTIMCLNSSTDYRLINRTQSTLNNLFVIYNSPNHPLSSIQQRLESIFYEFTRLSNISTVSNGKPSTSTTNPAMHLNMLGTEHGKIRVLDRSIYFVKQSTRVIWFGFEEICGTMRSALDYLELVRHFDYFILEGIYQLADSNKDVVRRLIWLTDVLYDNNCTLSISSNVPIECIYTGSLLSLEFRRTISRLLEMNTMLYLNKPLVNQNTQPNF